MSISIHFLKTIQTKIGIHIKSNSFKSNQNKATNINKLILTINKWIL